MSKNLRPLHEDPNFKEHTRKGGVNSGKARRRKADLKKRMELLLECEVVNEKTKQQLETHGLGASNEDLLAFSVFQKAIQGNQRAVENIIKLIASKDKYDIAEQKARIKKLKTEENTTNNNTNVTIVDRWVNDDI